MDHSRVPKIDFRIPLAQLEANLQQWQQLIPPVNGTHSAQDIAQAAKEAAKEAVEQQEDQ
jgi:hypothetical protein